MALKVIFKETVVTEGNFHSKWWIKIVEWKVFKYSKVKRRILRWDKRLIIEFIGLEKQKNNNKVILFSIPKRIYNKRNSIKNCSIFLKFILLSVSKEGREESFFLKRFCN